MDVAYSRTLFRLRFQRRITGCADSLPLERREMHSAMCRLSILGKHIFRNQCGSYRQEIEC